MLRRSSRSLSAYVPGLTLETMSQTVRKAQYAVRGAIVAKADDIKQKNPNAKLIYCNIGNPQALEQQPLSFPREVLALMSAPQLLSKPKADLERLFAPDAIARAQSMVQELGKDKLLTGAYTHSQGYTFVRNNIAKFITARDHRNSGRNDLGESNPANIYITNGASPAVQYALRMSINGPSDGIMIPIPQYPLYTATIALLNGSEVPYYLDESKAWGMKLADLEASYAEAQAKGVTPRALVIINPGNPTGQVLSVDVMRDVINFCHAKKVVLLADEVYQENVYGTKRFHSFREVLLGMTGSVKTETQLISFHTTSKGLIGECGRRGGYMELVNFDAKVSEQFLKCASIDLCPNVAGQIMTDLMVKEPAKGDASYERHEAEKKAIFSGLKERASLLVRELNKIPGISCNEIEGAMYAFPQIKISESVCKQAAKNGVAPDFEWCMELLEEKGIVLVPGSGFRQAPGTFHFRTTILPPTDQMRTVVESIAAFQAAKK